jgi:hypothetical protein
LSFRGLLTHLAAIVRNTMRPKDAKPAMVTFTLTTVANPKQRQALDLAAAIAASTAPRSPFQSPRLKHRRKHQFGRRNFGLIVSGFQPEKRHADYLRHTIPAGRR